MSSSSSPSWAAPPHVYSFLLPLGLLNQIDDRSEPDLIAPYAYSCSCATTRLIPPILLHFQFTFYISPSLESPPWSLPLFRQYSSVGRLAAITHLSVTPKSQQTLSRVDDCIFSLLPKFALEGCNPHLTRRLIRQTDTKSMSIFQSNRWTFRHKQAKRKERS